MHYPDESTEHKENDTSDYTIATLGDTATAVTCSLHVAMYVFPRAGLKGYATFERAAAAVRNGRAKGLLVPGAYPKVAQFLQNDDFGLAATFKHGIPALVYTNNLGARCAPIDVLFYHPATESLLEQLADIKIGTFEPVSSNEVAYNHMVAYGCGGACITNQLVIDHFGGTALETLRTERDMAWMLFERRVDMELTQKGAA